MSRPMRVPEETVELESHQKACRWATAALVSADAFDKWGPKDDAEQAAKVDASARHATKILEEAEAAIERRVAELRKESPTAIAAWVAAHHRLLDELLARTDDSTARFVATEERREWERLGLGEIDRVRQNTTYVHYDRGLYEALFGFPC